MKLRHWLPQFALRDFFWALLLVASLVAWGSEHGKMARRIEAARREALFSVLPPEMLTPSWGECLRRSKRVRFQSCSDQELAAILAASMSRGNPRSADDYEPALAELADRGCTDVLRDRYDDLMSRPGAGSEFRGPPNLELLTALRRSAGEPDPLTIEVRLGAKPQRDGLDSSPSDVLPETSEPSHWLLVTVTNRDIGNEEVTCRSGSNYGGERNNYWHVRLTDVSGNSVERSNYNSLFGGGGIRYFGRLPPGDRFGPSRLDLRLYIAPPQSGKYYLQVCYHNSADIARSSSLDGLIVSQSPLIPVTVVNPRDDDRLPSGLGPVAAILGLCGALTAVTWAFPRRPVKDATQEAPPASRLRRVVQHLVTRDACWIAIVAIVALAYAFDHTRQRAYLASFSPDAAAEWTLTIDEAP
jgi:hypothetical protein